MRTNIDIDDQLMAEALAATGARNKREVVTRGLEMLIRLARQKSAIEALRGLDPHWGEPPFTPASE